MLERFETFQHYYFHKGISITPAAPKRQVRLQNWSEAIRDRSKMLKAVHAQESKKAAHENAKAVVDQLKEIRLKAAAKKVEDSVDETLTYCDFPSEYWTRLRTNNVIERLNREIRRCTRVMGTFPDGNSTLMPVCAGLRHVTGIQRGNKKHMNIKHLEAAFKDVSIAGGPHSARVCKLFCT